VSFKLERGWVALEIEDEFPELGLRYGTLPVRPGRSPRAVKQRLAQLSNRFTGARAITLRREPVPWAYRVFFRQIGIDPDDRRTPAEALALERMKAGGFVSQNLVDDALTIATVETGVPVVALDADRVEGEIGLRLSEDGERLGGDGRPLSTSQIVIADRVRSLAVLFGDRAEGRGVRPQTERILLAAVQVKGVPEMSVEEALWTAVETLTGQIESVG
jgi:DNA/RNA-binding domain of Phe-tRNA-synthetase-like protein